MPLLPAGIRSLLIFLAALLLAAPATHAVTLTSQEQEIANSLHGSGQNRPFLVLDDTLTLVARQHAADMAKRHYFDHVNPDGHGPNWMVQQAGYRLPEAWGNSATLNYIESIAAGRASASSTWSDWMNSAPHRKHLLAEDSFYTTETSYGVGFASDPSSPYTYYWVVITAPPQPTPTITVFTPWDGQRITVPTVGLTGVTGGAATVQSVVYRVDTALGAGTISPANGTTSWNAQVTGLAPGWNVVRVQSRGSNGEPLADAAKYVDYVVPSPLVVRVAGEGSVTPGALGTTTQELGIQYSIAANASPGWLFTGWTGSANSSSPVLNFAMTVGFDVTANFVPNPFLTRNGGYAGFLPGSTPGMLKLTVGATGVFTGAMKYEGLIYSLSGSLGADGFATVTVSRAGKTPLTLNLHLDVSGQSGLTGSIEGGTTGGQFTAASDFRAGSGAFSGAGQYTISLPPAAGAGPQGCGYAMMLVDGSGRMILIGTLADGLPISASGTFSADGTLPLYIECYGGAGVLSGTLTARPTSTTDIDGSLFWSRPAFPNWPTFPEGFSVTTNAVGSRYVPPATGTAMLDFGNGSNQGLLRFSGGNLQTDAAQPCGLSATNSLTPGAAALAGIMTATSPADGRFAMRFIDPTTGAARVAIGVVLQKQHAGYGFFLGSTVAGNMAFTAAP